MRRSGRSGRRPERRATTPGDLSRLGARPEGPLATARSGAPYLVPAGLALVAAVAAWLSWGRLESCGAALATPETQVRRALAAQDRAHLDDVYGFRSGGTLELHPLRFDDVAPLVEGGRATVVAMLTAQGRAAWRDQRAEVSYLGRERFHMRPCSIAGWCGEGDQFDRLRGVLAALLRRHDAIATGDAEAFARLLAPGYADRGEDRAGAERRLRRELAGPPPRVRVVAWQIRVERDRAEVGEDREVAAAGSPPRRERRVSTLVREDARWLFLAGA